MKQQVFVIHGGTSFDTYEDYLDFIRTRDLDLEKLRHRFDWKVSLQAELGDTYDVLQPKMPNGTNVRYQEWCIWFERCASLLEDDVILIGHSLGGIFLAKYLSENIFGKRIKATILVAAPYGDTDTVESLREFMLPQSLEKFQVQGGPIYLLQSKDDPVVPYVQVEEYQRALPSAHTKIFDDKGHFNQEEFPELVELVKSL